MLTKSDKNAVLNLIIKSDTDLDSCIEKLISTPITECTVFFDCGGLNKDKFRLFIECIAAQYDLKKLCLRAWKPIDVKLAKELGGLVTKLSALETLNFEGFYSDVITKFLVKLIENSSTFSTLFIGSYNHLYRDSHISISVQSAIKLADALNNNKCLKKFTIKTDESECDWESQFIELIKPNRFLTHIILNDSIISPSLFVRVITNPKELEHTLDFLEKLPTLTHLGLCIYLPISAEQLKRFLEILNKNDKLKELNVVGFSKENNLYLGYEVLLHHPSIEKLMLGVRDYIDCQTGEMINALIQDNLNLISFTVRPHSYYLKNKKPLSVNFLTSLCETLENNQNLKHLYLDNNVMEENEKTGEIVATMIKKNKCLKSLSLAGCFPNSPNSVLQPIFSALTENETLLSLDIRFNKATIPSGFLIDFAKNTSLIRLITVTYLSTVEQAYNTRRYRHSLLSQSTENRLSFKNHLMIQQVLDRNRSLQFYKKYLLLLSIADGHFTLPIELVNFIYLLLIINENLAHVSAAVKAGSYLNLVQTPIDIERCQQIKISYVKTIYQALYQGQSSCSWFKHWNPLMENEGLAELEEIINYIEKNPKSRTEKAWKLANKYVDDYDEKKLFIKVHKYSLAHSSNIFGIFKRSQNFPNGYFNLEHQIVNAEEGSRTATIAAILKPLF